MSKGNRRTGGSGSSALTARPAVAPYQIEHVGAQAMLTVNGWALPSPSIEYQADAANIEVVAGSPTIFFAQVVGEHVLNAIALQMPVKRFREMMASFHALIPKLPSFTEWDLTIQLPEVDLANASHQNFRKFFASFARGGCNEDFAMMDFYRMSLLTEQQADKSDLVEPCVRVFMNPILFTRLLKRAEQIDGRVKEER